MFLSSVVAAAVAYPYPYPVAIAYPDQVPHYAAAPKFDEPIARADHHGYEEHLGRVKMQVGTVFHRVNVSVKYIHWECVSSNGFPAGRLVRHSGWQFNCPPKIPPNSWVKSTIRRALPAQFI